METAPMDTMTDHHHVHPPPRMQFSEDIAMAARLFISMIRNCTYEDPIDFEYYESDLDQISASETPPTSSGDLTGLKRKANGSAGHTRKKSRRVTSAKPSKRQIPKDTVVAAYVKLSKADDNEWLLCSVAGYEAEKKAYIVVDADEEVNRSKLKKYKVIRKNMRILDSVPNRSRSKGSRVLAVYPETTVFYPAVVKSFVKRRAEEYYRLEFEGEEEPGEAVDVPAKYVIDMERTT